MKALRLVLIGLAAIIFVGLGWRLTSAPWRGKPGDRSVASNMSTTPSAPVVPAPAQPSAPSVPKPPTTPNQKQAPSSGPTTIPPRKSETAPDGAQPPAAGQSSTGLTAQAARQRLDAILATAPDLAQAFAMLKAQFPAAAERSMGAATEALRASGVAPSPDDLFASAMRELRLSSGVLAAKSGPEALSGIFDMKAATLADLEQADPRICADYLFGGTSPEYADFEAGHRALVAKVALVNIQAMADGRTQQKDWGAPSTDDFKWIENALAAKGLSPSEIGALLDGTSPDPPLSDARLCDNARTYLDVIRAMPSEARNRIYGLAAELLARS